MLINFEDDEEKFIRMEFQIQSTQDELLGNSDFQYLLQKSEDLFAMYYNPQQAKKYHNPHHMQKLLADITKQLFSNEIQVIAGLTGHYNDKIKKIQSNTKGSHTKTTKVKEASVFRNPIYLNNPNFIKKKRLIITKDIQTQTDPMKEDETGKPIMSETEIENKVASKLVHMLLSKGVSKIIKKYGYLPVDYLKNEKNEKTLEMMGESQSLPKKKRGTSGKRFT